MKLTFLGAGSTIFARNVIGDCMCSEVLRDSVFALYDIDGERIEESRTILEAIRKGVTPAEAYEQNIKTYGRFDEAVKKIDPRKE